MALIYPSDPAEAALALFQRWLGREYARSVTVAAQEPAGALLDATLTLGRRWQLGVTIVNTFAADADLPWEVARSAVEQRLDAAGLSVALWVPRGAPLPSAEPHLSTVAIAVEEARPIEDGRAEAVFPVELYLRRNATTGSVVTVLGGLAAHWAQFTNRVPGSYQLNALALHRLPASQESRDDLAERIILAAGQPLADETQVIPAEDCWTVTPLGDGRAYVLGSPRLETDAQSAALRRNLRALLKQVAGLPRPAVEARALVILGGSTYASEEKFSIILRGMDPSLYAGHTIVAVITDGAVRIPVKPPRGTLPWDAPLPGS